MENYQDLILMSIVFFISFFAGKKYKAIRQESKKSESDKKIAHEK